jgi:hypothetical protein
MTEKRKRKGVWVSFGVKRDGDRRGEAMMNEHTRIAIKRVQIGAKTPAN